MDIRYEKLAATLAYHSTKLNPGEKVLVHAIDIPRDMTIALVRSIRECKAIPFVQIQDGRIERECILGAESVQFETFVRVGTKENEKYGRIYCGSRLTQCI